MAEERLRPAWAEIDLDALAHNVALMRRRVSPARLCAVVKADAYGHGALVVAPAVLQAGAEWLAVVLPEEGVELRQAGIDAPILLLFEPPAAAMLEVLEGGLTPTVYSPGGVAAAEAAASELGLAEVAVHLKVDTGMHRVGVPPGEARALARAIGASPHLLLQGLWTHLAVADEPAHGLTARQLALFDSVSAGLRADGVEPELRHAANSAGALGHLGSHFDMVRAGVALYGYDPRAAEAGEAAAGEALELRPILSLHSRVALLRELGAGERVSYGQRRALAGRSWVATVPIGYADGVPRRLFDAGMEVLIGGRRRPLAGTVTMDQILVDCGPDHDVAVGDEVVLIGTQAGETITARDWADALGTICYEVLCGIGRRVPRVAVGRDRVE